MISISISSLTASDGSEIAIPERGLVLLVGPNNVGKSQVLRDITGLVNDPQGHSKALTQLALEKPISDESLIDWFRQHLRQLKSDLSGSIYQVPGWGNVPLDQISSQWNQPGLNFFTSMFLFHADGNSRLGAGNSQPSFAPATETPASPLQLAYVSPEIEKKLDAMVRKAFGTGVLVDRYNGSILTLRVGDAPTFDHENGLPTASYLQELSELPRLEDQGDGMRSYVGLALFLAAGDHQIFLIDEPEAFLHPPQARQLGRVLADLASDQQVFVATHSSSVVQGALESSVETTVLRMTRSTNINHVSYLGSTDVRSLWADSLLRYSNVLDGLFHDVVVLCEGDADCRFYQAVLDELAEEDAGSNVRTPEYLFTQCGGKSRFASVLRTLKSVAVPVIVVTDFDFLREPNSVKKVVDLQGGDFTDFETELNLLNSALVSDSKPLRKLSLRDDFLDKLDSLTGETLSDKDAEALRRVIRSESGWDKCKRAGIAAVPAGNAAVAAQNLLNKLSKLRIMVVPVGELERFETTVGGHGPGWVAEVLERGVHRDPGRDARDFVNAIRSAGQRAQDRAP